MSKEIELKDWTPKLAANMAKVRVRRMRKAAAEFSRDISILYEDVDFHLCETARTLENIVEDELDKFDEVVNETLGPDGLT